MFHRPGGHENVFQTATPVLCCGAEPLQGDPAMLPKPKGRPRKHPAPPGQSAAPSLERALALLDEIARSPGQTLSDLAAASAQPVASVYRALAALQARGLVEQIGPDQRLHIGPAAFRLGCAYQGRARLADRARPLLADLAQDSGETAALVQWLGDGAVVLAESAPAQDIRAALPPGTRLALHASAAGKALVAWGGPDRAEATLAMGLERLTSLTLTSDTALLRDLSRARERGFALDDQESAEGLRGVAAPVCDETGLAVAALAVCGPAFRLGLSDAMRLGASLRETADRLTEAIGGQVQG